MKRGIFAFVIGALFFSLFMLGVLVDRHSTKNVPVVEYTRDFDHLIELPVTPQQKASHMIRMFDENENAMGLCTATATGPHTLLTAEHCVLRNKKYAQTVKVDLSTRDYPIRSIGSDDRDHVILVVDGPEFTNTISVDNPKDVAVGTPVYIYGNGDGHYPGVRVDGIVTDCKDPSDVDEAQGVVCFSIPVIGGDSGSLVFDANNNPVAVVTYRHTEDRGNSGVGFKLKNDPKAFTYKKVEPPKESPKLTLNNLFGLS